jgi:hypothetical protein
MYDPATGMFVPAAARMSEGVSLHQHLPALH